MMITFVGSVSDLIAVAEPLLQLVIRRDLREN
jgi:hypothetical protein